MTVHTLYRVLLRLYPRRFRDDYGADMALLFADQMRDEAPARVCARTIADLVVTIPTRHLEAHMKRTPGPSLPLAVGALSLVAATVAVVGGTSRWALVVGFPVAVVAAVLAAALWHGTRPIAMPRDTTARWWRYLVGGAALLAALIITTTATGEVPEVLWLPTMAAFLLAIVLTATGVVLTVAHLSNGRHRHVAR